MSYNINQEQEISLIILLYILIYLILHLFFPGIRYGNVKEKMDSLNQRGDRLCLKKPKKKTDKKLTKEQQLEKEIELLRAENAYLKKLRASGINIPNRLRK